MAEEGSDAEDLEQNRLITSALKRRFHTTVPKPYNRNALEIGGELQVKLAEAELDLILPLTITGLLEHFPVEMSDTAFGPEWEIEYPKEACDNLAQVYMQAKIVPDLEAGKKMAKQYALNCMKEINKQFVEQEKNI